MTAVPHRRDAIVARQAALLHGATPHVLLTIDLVTLLGRGDLATRPPRLASGTKLDLDRALTLLEQAKLTRC